MKNKDLNLPIYVGSDQHKVEDGDVFFECKDDGKFWYRKIIANKRHTYTDKGVEKYYGAKSTGKWMHEDTFAEKFINPHKKIVHIVEFEKKYGGIQYIKDTFNPETGWTSNPFPVEKTI